MRALLGLALVLVGIAAVAPTAAADYVLLSIDFSGDGRCEGPRENIVLPTGDLAHNHDTTCIT